MDECDYWVTCEDSESYDDAMREAMEAALEHLHTGVVRLLLEIIEDYDILSVDEETLLRIRRSGDGELWQLVAADDEPEWRWRPPFFYTEADGRGEDACWELEAAIDAMQEELRQMRRAARDRSDEAASAFTRFYP